MKFLQRLSVFCNKWVEQSLAALGLSMACIVILQVFCRYVLNYSLFWSEELARYILVWLTFLGASSAYYRGVHPGIDVVTIRLQKTARKICGIIVHLVSMFLFFIMIYHGIVFAYFIRSQISPALALPKWLICSVIPLSGCFFLLHCIVFLLSDIKAWNHDN